MGIQLAEALKKAKVTPLALLLIFAGVVLIAYVSLGASFLRQRFERDRLSSQIDLAQGVLVAAGNTRKTLADLEDSLDATEQELELAERAFPTELDGNDVLESILTYANDSHVYVVRMQTRPVAVETNEIGSYSVLGFHFEFAGGFSELADFLVALDSGALNTSKTGAFSLQDEGGWHSLALEVLTYARIPVEEAAAPETPAGSAGPAPETAGGGEATPNE